MNKKEIFLTEPKKTKSIHSWLQKIKEIDTLDFNLIKSEINMTMDRQFKPRDFISGGKLSTRRSMNAN